MGGHQHGQCLPPCLCNCCAHFYYLPALSKNAQIKPTEQLIIVLCGSHTEIDKMAIQRLFNFGFYFYAIKKCHIHRAQVIAQKPYFMVPLFTKCVCECIKPIKLFMKQFKCVLKCDDRSHQNRFVIDAAVVSFIFVLSVCVAITRCTLLIKCYNVIENIVDCVHCSMRKKNQVRSTRDHQMKRVSKRDVEIMKPPSVSCKQQHSCATIVKIGITLNHCHLDTTHRHYHHCDLISRFGSTCAYKVLPPTKFA